MRTNKVKYFNHYITIFPNVICTHLNVVSFTAQSRNCTIDIMCNSLLCFIQ